MACSDYKMLRTLKRCIASIEHPMRSLILDNYAQSRLFDSQERMYLSDYFSLSKVECPKEKIQSILLGSPEEGGRAFNGRIVILLMSLCDYSKDMININITNSVDSRIYRRIEKLVSGAQDMWSTFFVMSYQLNKILQFDSGSKVASAKFLQSYTSSRDIIALDYMPFTIDVYAKISYLLKRKFEKLNLELDVEMLTKQKVNDDISLIYPVTISNPKTKASLSVFLYQRQVSDPIDFFMQYFEYCIFQKIDANLIALPGDQAGIDTLLQHLDTLPEVISNNKSPEPIDTLRSHLEKLINTEKNA